MSEKCNLALLEMTTNARLIVFKQQQKKKPKRIITIQL